MRINFNFIDDEKTTNFILIRKYLKNNNINELDIIPAFKNNQKQFYFTVEIDGRKTNKFIKELKNQTSVIKIDKIYNIKKDYKTLKNEARSSVIELQNEINNLSLSYGGLVIMQDFFEKVARRYGLIKEFTENGII